MRDQFFSSLLSSLSNIFNSLHLSFVETSEPITNVQILGLLVDYDSSDEISDAIDAIENNGILSKYTKDNKTNDFFSFILENPFYFQELLGDENCTHLLNKRTRYFQELYLNGEVPNETDLDKIFDDKATEIRDLCKQYSVPTSTSTNAYAMLIELFTQGIRYLLNPVFIILKQHFVRNDSFVENVLGDFNSFFHRSPKIILSGIHGTGKTTFLTSLLKTIEKYGISHSYFSYKPGLIASLEQTFESANKFFILIIDDMNPDKNIFFSETKKLSSYNFCVILSTIHPFCPDGFQKYTLPNLSNDEWSQLLPEDSLSNETIVALKTFTNNNPYLLSLIDKTRKASPESITDLLKNSMAIRTEDQSKLPKFKHTYDPSKIAFWGHAYKIYDLNKYKYYEPHRKHLKILSCFFDRAVPSDFLKYIFPEYNNICLSELVEMGYLEGIKQSDIYAVRLSPAFANIIFYRDKLSNSDIRSVLENVINYLLTYDSTLNLRLLGDLLYPFALRLRPSIRLKNNPKQKSVSETQEYWWDFLDLTIEFYQMNNMPEIADLFVNLLEYPDDIQYQKSNLDPKIYIIFNKWIVNGFSANNEDIDELISKITKARYNSNTEILKLLPATQYLSRNALDLIISKELQFLLPSAEKAQKTCNGLLESLNTASTFDKYSYYKQICSLIFSDISQLDFNMFNQLFIRAHTNHIKSQQIFELCILIHICFKKFIFEAEHLTPLDHLFELLKNLVYKLKEIIQSVSFLPKLLGNICFSSYMDFHIIALSPYFSYQKYDLSYEDFCDLLNKCVTMTETERELCKQAAMRKPQDYE